MTVLQSDLFAGGPLVSGLFTASGYLAIGETEQRTELVEGRLLLSPGNSPSHQHALMELLAALGDQLPEGLEALYSLDVDLRLTGPEEPGWVRCPDVVVARRAAFDAVGDGECLTASDVVLVGEITSPGTRRTDHLYKPGEYAEAGIPHYWIVDLTEPVSMTTHHLAGEFGYADGGVVTGTYSASTPFPVELDLDALVRTDPGSR